jgi:hypothetical protein
VHRGIIDSEGLTQNFKVTFSFESNSPLVDSYLQIIRSNIFVEGDHIEIVPSCSTHKESVIVHELLECYNFIEEDQEEEDSRNVKVPDTEGECKVVGLELKFDAYVKPLRVHKVNICMKEKPKFMNIGGPLE